MYIIKQKLCEVVDQAYAKDPQLPRYKKFYVEIIDKDLSSKHGDYNCRTHHIRIFNLYRDNSAIIATTLHEVAHHIDWCNRGTTGHNAEFYAVYKKLLFAALDLGVFSKGSYLNAIRDSSDGNKVRKILSGYAPNSNKKNQKMKITIENGYEIRKILSDIGFRYNRQSKAWEKSVLPKDLPAEKKSLGALNVNYSVSREDSMSIQKKCYLIAKKGSYEERFRLKAEGFVWEKASKTWRKEVSSPERKSELKKYSSMFPDVEFYLG